MHEEWRPVVGYEGYYEVSRTGRVRNLGRETFHTGRWTRSGTRFAPVWMAAEIPADCPKPEPKRKATA